MDEVREPVLVAEVTGARGEVACADAAGARLAAGGGDGALRLWSWARGAGWAAAGETRAHRYGVTAVRFSPCAWLLASAGVDGAARVWSGRSLVPRSALAAAGAAPARALVWAGLRLVVGHDDGAVRVWAARPSALLACVRPHEGAVYALACLGDNAMLLTGCTEGVLKIHDFEELVKGGDGSAGPTPLLWEDGAHDLGVSCACASADGRAAASGGRDGLVRLWVLSGAERGSGRRAEPGGVLTGHTGAVAALSWARHLLASAAADRTARVWAPRAGVCLRVLHAHPRYLTSVAIAHDARYMITGSNDKTVRTWSLGAFSLDDEIQPACNPVAHFGLGDLEGIGPVDDTILEGDLAESAELEDKNEGVCVWSESYNSAINCIAAYGDRFATASSDGQVRVFAWSMASGRAVVRAEHALRAHSYPALAVDFGASGALLLSAGMDGYARLWDVQSGGELAALCVERVGAGAGAGGGGGGGVRDARLAPRGDARVLLASDNGAAAVWSLRPPAPDPKYVYGGMAEAATCCAWSADGRLVAVGGAAGELRLFAPPRTRAVAYEANAHDLGVLSCDFALICDETESEGSVEHLLATGGHDALVRVWTVRAAGGGRAELRPALALAAHGGSVHATRWRGALLATGGADRWARVWRVTNRGGQVSAMPLAAVSAGGAGGAAAARLLTGELLAVGSVAGELALWRLPAERAAADGERGRGDGEGAAAGEDEDEDEAGARGWGARGVRRWLLEYVTRLPGSSLPEADEARLLARAHAAALTGARLLDEPLPDLLRAFGYGEEENETERDELRERIHDELHWLRRNYLPDDTEVPHSLLCPLTHRVLREPVRAADGFTYDRAALAACRFATDELVSPMSGRRMRSAAVAPNYRVRERLRELHGWQRGTDCET